MNSFAGQIDDIALDRALADKGFREFIPMAWHLACPSSEFIPGWHIDAIADHLEACYNREIKNLVINVPPGSSKSLAACVLFPAWCWTQDGINPSYGAKERFIYGAHDENLAQRDSMTTRNLIGSEWYQERWGDRVEFDMNQTHTGGIFYNKQGGFRKIVTVGGSVVGFHGSIQVTDDPLKPLEMAGSAQVAGTALNKASEWWNTTMTTRAVDFNRLVRIIIMQRLHHADLAGEMIKTGDYEHLMLPMEYEHERKCMIEVTGFEDPRVEESTLLCPERFDAEAVTKLKRELGVRGAQAQLQQNPTPLEGATFRADQVVYYTEVPRGPKRMIQSWDCTFAKTEDGSFVAGHIWAKIGPDYYLIDRVKERMDFTATCNSIIAMSRKWPKTITKVIEKKANGDAIHSHLHKKLPGITLVTPMGGKESRANAIAPLWEAGNIKLPSPTIAPWVHDFVEEVCSFPSYPTDDDVDAMSQGIVFLHKRSIARLKAAMSNAARIT